MYMDAEMKRQVLAMLGQKGGSITFNLVQPREHLLQSSGPPEAEVWQVACFLASVGLAGRSGINEQAGTETITLTKAGWEALENPSAPLPTPEDANVAADSGIGMHAQFKEWQS